MSKNTIERFNTYERVLHWFVTGTFFTLLLSGLGLYSRLFTGYFSLFGGGQNAIFFHKIAGIFFFFSSLLLFLHNRKRTTDFDDDDRTWFKTMGGYLSKQEAHHVPVGKFNAGQKMFAVFIGVATVILGITGIFIWNPTIYPRWLVQVSLLTHGLMFVGSIMFVVAHVYLATIGNPGTIDAMLYGDVKRSWAKKHHPKWYKEVTDENR